jgi:hypothetical protein
VVYRLEAGKERPKRMDEVTPFFTLVTPHLVMKPPVVGFPRVLFSVVFR